MIIDNAQAFYEENETLKMENEKLENEVKSYEIKFSKLKEDHDQVESENFDLKNKNEKLIDHNENLKFDNDQLNKQISNMAHDQQTKVKCINLFFRSLKLVCHDIQTILYFVLFNFTLNNLIFQVSNFLLSIVPFII